MTHVAKNSSYKPTSRAARPNQTSSVGSQLMISARVPPTHDTTASRPSKNNTYSSGPRSHPYLPPHFLLLPGFQPATLSSLDPKPAEPILAARMNNDDQTILTAILLLEFVFFAITFATATPRAVARCGLIIDPLPIYTSDQHSLIWHSIA